jgi:hypothetical protein
MRGIKRQGLAQGLGGLRRPLQSQQDETELPVDHRIPWRGPRRALQQRCGLDRATTAVQGFRELAQVLFGACRRRPCAPLAGRAGHPRYPRPVQAAMFELPAAPAWARRIPPHRLG